MKFNIKSGFTMLIYLVITIAISSTVMEGYRTKTYQWIGRLDNFSAVQCSTVQYSTVQYNTAPYKNAKYGSGLERSRFLNITI